MTAKIDPEVSRDADIARIAELLHKAGLIADNGLWLDRSLATPFARALYDAGLRASAEPLDTAWREAEAALPDGLALELHGSVVSRGALYYAEARRDLTAAREGHGWGTVEDTVGDTPEAALRALRAVLDAGDPPCPDCERTHPWRDHSDPAIEELMTAIQEFGIRLVQDHRDIPYDVIEEVDRIEALAALLPTQASDSKEKP